MSERLPKGGECQCVLCGRFFTGLSSFDAHHKRSGRGDTAVTVCDTEGLVSYSRSGGPTWGQPAEEDAKVPWKASA